MARRRNIPRRDESFRLRLSTMLILVAIVTHARLGLDALLSISDLFHSTMLSEALTAFSQMTDRLLGIAVIAALFFGVRAFRRGEYAMQYWLEIALSIAMILLMHAPGGPAAG